MTKGKGLSSEPPQTMREMWRWTKEMDFIKLIAFTEEQTKGNRVNVPGYRWCMLMLLAL
ncbi:hypothetical protein SESBI_34949 [Sesbania bispinosa]|nr:hypothetical protein SESBI_34949 [Sesbania bispinosa]